MSTTKRASMTEEVAVPASWVDDPRDPPAQDRKIRVSKPLAAMVRQSQSQRGDDQHIVALLVKLEQSGHGSSVVQILTDLTESAAEPEPNHAFTEAQQEALAGSGSLVIEMPPVSRRASVRTKLAARQVLDGALTVAQVAQKLGVTESRVRQRVAQRSLYSVRSAHGTVFPVFQFEDEGTIPGWDEVAPHFPADAHLVSVTRFMDATHEDLDVDGDVVSPREWLASGGSAEAVAELVDDAYQIN